MVAVSGPLSDLHRLSLSRESFAVCCPLTLLGNASYRVRVLTRRFASRFFQQYPHGRRLAVYSGRYDQLPGRTCTSKSRSILGIQQARERTRPFIRSRIASSSRVASPGAAIPKLGRHGTRPREGAPRAKSRALVFVRCNTGSPAICDRTLRLIASVPSESSSCA